LRLFGQCDVGKHGFQGIGHFNRKLIKNVIVMH
jgi:hypothetical protein